jgi:hypothetical protein
MTTEYQIRVKDVAGDTQAIVTDFISLAYAKKINEPGLGSFVLPGSHEAIDVLVDKGQVEFWRRNQDQDIDWYCDFYGLYREPDRSGGRPGRFVGTCPGQLDMLRWRRVAWKAGTASRSQFTGVAAETIMKTLVAYNAGSSATTGNGRIRTGTITGISTAADGANGNSVDWYCAFDNLLETLQKLALIAGGDFDLVKVGAQAWEFRWYTTRRGTDRSSSVIFSLEYDNMANPVYRTRRMAERTVALVGGQGEGSLREVVTRTGPNYAAGNDIEMFVDARNVSSTAGLNAKGDAELEQARAYDEFSFDVLQTAVSLYGKHYFLGDLVTAVNPYTGASLSKKISGVTVAVQDGRESIQVETADE